MLPRAHSMAASRSSSASASLNAASIARSYPAIFTLEPACISRVNRPPPLQFQEPGLARLGRPSCSPQRFSIPSAIPLPHSITRTYVRTPKPVTVRGPIALIGMKSESYEVSHKSAGHQCSCRELLRVSRRPAALRQPLPAGEESPRELRRHSRSAELRAVV